MFGGDASCFPCSPRRRSMCASASLFRCLRLFRLWPPRRWWSCPGRMSMPFPTWMRRSFSAAAGGGDIGRAVGIVRNTTITDGRIIGAIPPGTEKCRGIGVFTIETIGGAGIPGIPAMFDPGICIGIGRAVIGVMTPDGGIPAAPGEGGRPVTGEAPEATTACTGVEPAAGTRQGAVAPVPTCGDTRFPSAEGTAGKRLPGDAGGLPSRIGRRPP